MKIKNKILALIYREKDKKIELLALRNNPRDLIHGGDFYYVVTGGVKDGESFNDAITREIKEETGIENIIKIQDIEIIFEYTCAGEQGYLCKEKSYIVRGMAKSKDLVKSI